MHRDIAVAISRALDLHSHFAPETLWIGKATNRLGPEEHTQIIVEHCIWSEYCHPRRGVAPVARSDMIGDDLRRVTGKYRSE